jgi:hypothetical protein
MPSLYTEDSVPLPVAGTLIMGRYNAVPTARTAVDGNVTSVATDQFGRIQLGANASTGETHLGEVGGRLVSVGVNFTRPSDTTAYAAKDAVSDSTSAPTILTFANFARIAAGSGYIVRANMMTDQTTLTARLRLHLFHTSVTAINDNAAFTLLYANRASRIGYIDFDPGVTEGAGSTASHSLNAITRLPFVCAAASRSVFGLLETLDIFTPASAQAFYVELIGDLN